MTSKSTFKRVTVQKTGKMPEPTHRTQDFEQLIMIANLEDNWDRYGAERVCDECVENAKSVISSLPPFVPSPDIFPNPNGTVTLEWDDDVGSFSIEIGKEEFSSFLEVAGKQRYYQGHFELGLPDFARAIIQKRISHVVVPSEFVNKMDYWADSQKAARTMFAVPYRLLKGYR